MSFRARDFVRGIRATPQVDRRRLLPEDHSAEKVGDLFAALAIELRAAMPNEFARSDRLVAERPDPECEQCGRPFPRKNGSGNNHKRFCRPTCQKLAWIKNKRSKR